MRKLISVTIALMLLACGAGKKKETFKFEVENTNQEVLSQEHLTSKDSIFLISIIYELKGIEKFYVKDDFNRLASLLDYRKSNHYSEVSSILGKLSNKYYDIDDFYPRENIDTIINSTGFLKYYSPFINRDGTITYWKQSDGTPFIGHEKLSDGGEVNLFFEKFEGDQYVEVELSFIIPSINNILENGNVKRFILPEKGKNIIIQTENQTRELVWNDGVFEEFK